MKALANNEMHGGYLDLWCLLPRIRVVLFLMELILEVLGQRPRAVVFLLLACRYRGDFELLG